MITTLHAQCSYLLQNAYVAQMIMHMCIICNPIVHLCKSIFFAVLPINNFKYQHTDTDNGPSLIYYTLILIVGYFY